MDPNLLYGRIAEIAPEWDPFPVLQAMDQGPAPGVGVNTMQGQESAYGWMQPQGAGPVLPQGQQPPGVQVVPQGVQGQPQGPAPFSAQQMAALAAMQQRGQMQQPRLPAVAPQRGGGQQIQMQPIALPQPAMQQRPGFAQIFGGRR